MPVQIKPDRRERIRLLEVTFLWACDKRAVVWGICLEEGFAILTRVFPTEFASHMGLTKFSEPFPDGFSVQRGSERMDEQKSRKINKTQPDTPEKNRQKNETSTRIRKNLDSKKAALQLGNSIEITVGHFRTRVLHFYPIKHLRPLCNSLVDIHLFQLGAEYEIS